MSTPNITARRVQDYLADLNAALAHLPGERRREIVADIRGHIDAALADAGDDSPITVDAVLDRLGAPQEIATAAENELPAKRRTLLRRDLFTVLLLLAGGVLLPIIGWVVGVALLWSSASWRRRDQVIGTLLIPGGLLIPALLGLLPIGSTSVGCAGNPAIAGHPVSRSGQHCSATASGALPAWLLVVLLILTAAIPLWTAWWLTRQARPGS